MQSGIAMLQELLDFMKPMLKLPKLQVKKAFDKWWCSRVRLVKNWRKILTRMIIEYVLQKRSTYSNFDYQRIERVLGKTDEALKYFGNTTLFVIVLWNNICACMLSCFSHVWLCATVWTITCQVPLSMGFSRQEILEWVAIRSSRGSSPPWNRNCISYASCIGRQTLYH